MIGAFPDLYPDEMLTSGWARYEAWVGYMRRPALLDELFGGRKYSLVFDLPAPLGHFVASLPPGHSARSLDQLIQQHTLLPYYTAFLPSEQVRVAYEMMRGERSVKIHNFVGLAGGKTPKPKLLRYCPSCVTEDRERYGETYWHRIHQAAGVHVCPQHATWLETTAAPMWIVKGPTNFISAEASVQPVEARWLSPESNLEQKLLWLAQNVQWLLEHPGLSAEVFLLNERFNLELVSRGLSTYNRHRRLSQTLAQIRETLTPELLTCMGCDWSTDKYGNWITRLLRDAHDMRFALYQLLGVLFFAESVPAFLQLPAEMKAFGDGPWPCLNPACPKYRQPCIDVCEMDFDHKGFPRGTFACECGFTYSRVGPDTSSKDRYRAGTVLSHGALWEQMLQTLWFDPDVGAAEMERCMHSSWQHLREYATRLGFPFPPPGVRPSVRTATQLHRHCRWDLNPTPYREAWLELMRLNPEAGPKALSQMDLNLYCWLRNHDREWLKAHTPPRKPRVFISHRIDWEQRDQHMVAQLEEAFERLRNRQDPPMRISANALLLETGQDSQFHDSCCHMPLAVATLQRLTESYEDFAVRRIWHVAHRMRLNGVAPRRYVLAAEASVVRYDKTNLRIQTVIDAALAWLQAPDDGTPGDNSILPLDLAQEALHAV